jgi:hypothetical protein
MAVHRVEKEAGMSKYTKQPIRNPQAYNRTAYNNWNLRLEVMNLMELDADNAERFETMCSRLNHVHELREVEEWARGKFPGWDADILKIQTSRIRQMRAIYRGDDYKEDR